MKKFIIACAVIVMLAAGGLFLSSRIGLTFQWESLRKTSVETFTKVEGKTILVDQGQGMEPFEIRGANLGSGIPGHFATDYAIDKETYLRWFAEIQAMGANCIRVYTLLQDDFYNAFWEYNKDREQPLYLIHGLWVNDYTLFSHRDAYDPDFMNTMIQDSRTLVDIIHGNKRFSLGEGLGSGSYNHDISQWVLGYILGVEWEDTTVAFTDHMQDKKNQYHGKYMTTTDDASPFEAMLAQVGDKIIEYETQTYKAQRLIAFANWPTTDRLNGIRWSNTTSVNLNRSTSSISRQPTGFCRGSLLPTTSIPTIPITMALWTSWTLMLKTSGSLSTLTASSIPIRLI